MAFDTGPGNALMDEWALRHTGEAMDRDGNLASRGKADEVAVKAFLAHPFFDMAPAKSLDPSDFSLFLVDGMEILDAAATPRQWIIAGGGRITPHS